MGQGGGECSNEERGWGGGGRDREEIIEERRHRGMRVAVTCFTACFFVLLCAGIWY